MKRTARKRLTSHQTERLLAKRARVGDSEDVRGRIPSEDEGTHRTSDESNVGREEPMEQDPDSTEPSEDDGVLMIETSCGDNDSDDDDSDQKGDEAEDMNMDGDDEEEPEEEEEFVPETPIADMGEQPTEFVDPAVVIWEKLKQALVEYHEVGGWVEIFGDFGYPWIQVYMIPPVEVIEISDDEEVVPTNPEIMDVFVPSDDEDEVVEVVNISDDEWIVIESDPDE